MEVVDFSSKDCAKCKLYWKKNRKIYEGQGFNGLMIYSDEKNIQSKYYCQIKAFYKVDKDNSLVIVWDDDFKVQDQLGMLEEKKISAWMYMLLNGHSKVVKKGSVMSFECYESKNKPVDLKLKLILD